VTPAEKEIPDPLSSGEMLTALDLSTGMTIAPLTRLLTMESGLWEDFTLELASHWKSTYKKVVRCGGGGDLGRDVIGFLSDGWENFQCKFYSTKLSVAEAVLEVGKVAYYTFKREYSFPKKYYFVSPKGNGTDLIKVLSDPTGGKMKSELIKRWDKICKDGITKKESIPLTGEFLDYVEKVMDFTIFDDIPPLKLIELHRNTPYHAIRFGIYHQKRPSPPEAPKSIDWGVEQKYVQALLDAFSQYKSTLIDSSMIGKFKDLERQLTTARNNFYSAAALDRFSRDWLPPSSFKDLKDECYEAISATASMKYSDGYARYLKTLEQSVQVSYHSHPLNLYMKNQDKKGLCHHLANDDILKWTSDE